MPSTSSHIGHIGQPIDLGISYEEPFLKEYIPEHFYTRFHGKMKNSIKLVRTIVLFLFIEETTPPSLT